MPAVARGVGDAGLVMVGEETKWLIGLLLGAVLAAGGTMIAAFNRLADRISKGDDALHTRINHISEEYVRRVDLDGHLGRVDTAIRDFKNEMREQHRDTQQRLDRVLTAVKGRTKDEN